MNVQNLRDLNLKVSYDTSEDEVIDSFYHPVLSVASSYDRITGFFTSTSLAITGQQLFTIAENNGKIRLIMSPFLNEDDAQIIQKAEVYPEEYISDVLIRQIVNKTTQDEDEYRQLLAHLVARGNLDIRIAFVKKEEKYLTSEEVDKSAIFHQKIGIIRDKNNDILTFSGSINETLSGWINNVEEFKVFKSWIPGQSIYVNADIEKFENFWSGNRKNIIIKSLPKAVEANLIQISKKEDFNTLVKRLKKRKETKISLFVYQKEALNKWLHSQRRMLFNMATGTGKTRTAIACIDYLQRNNSKATLYIIATPQNALSMQWKSEIQALKVSFDKEIIADSTNMKWKKSLEEIIHLLNLNIINSAIIYTTHKTASSERFLNMIKIINEEKVDTCFVGDEVHALGSANYMKALSNNYIYRIGLSATPDRWFDDKGTDYLREYFEHNYYEFGIDKALREINPITYRTFLCPYLYHIRHVKLTEIEENKFIELSDKISKRKLIENSEEDEYLDKLYFLRSEIIKSASNKIKALKELLMSFEHIESTIIFVSPIQLREVLFLLHDLRIKAAPITKDQGNKPEKKYNGKSERQVLIDNFKNKRLQVIVGIKCLDEGIDIPEAQRAILMSSTTNPREYIQRIGRVIRRNKNKEFAEIYDFLCYSEDPDLNQKIQNKEKERAEYIINNASNKYDAINELYSR